MAAQIQHWQFTVEDYARMLEAGILSEDDRVELIDGEVRAMSPIGSVHAAIVKRLRSRMGVLSGAARVNGRVVCDGTMTFALGPKAGQAESQS